VIYRLILLAIMLCYAGAAEAYGSLRCKGKIIDPGATMAEVVALCGPPSTRIISQVPARARVATGFSRFIGFTTTEQWVYDRGWGKFPAVLTFHDGKILRIDYLPYRSGDV
jgi:hypothetical protein